MLMASSPIEQTTASRRLWTAQEAAIEWRVSIWTVWALIRDGKIPVIKIGRQYRIKQAVIDAGMPN